MKKVFKFVKGKKEGGIGIAHSQSRDLSSPAQTPEDERFLTLDAGSGYIVDFCGKDKTLTKLHKAAWQGHLEKLKSALKKIEIDSVDRHNRSALHFAVAQGHPNIVWFLLGNNAKMTICDDDGCTPLLKAIECGHKDCMSLLLERGADINNADYQGNTGLHIAAKQGNLDIASTLLSRGAALDTPNNCGECPLHIATRSQNKDLVELFLSRKASVNVCDRENRTSLMLAAKTGNFLLTQLLFEHGAQLTVVDSNGWTAEDYALLGGHETVANQLKSFASSLKEAQSENRPEDETVKSNEESSTWNDESDTSGGQGDKNILEVKAPEASGSDKNDELSDSPDSGAMPPPCQPPRSWEMIQAGMIDSVQQGSESKRRSITALGTLHSRRESFTEAQIEASKYTHSLNRRRVVKRENSFAKQRLSFNEEESLRSWMTDSSSTLKEIDKMGLDKILGIDSGGDKNAESDLPIGSGNNCPIVMSPVTESGGKCDLSARETFNGTDEVWVANATKVKEDESEISSWDSEEPDHREEASFPPPPTGIELGVNMAKSIGCMKGISIDHPVGNVIERNVRSPADAIRPSEDESIGGRSLLGSKRHSRHQSISSHKWRSEELPQNHKSVDRLVDVNRRINEQLQCYDQALKELAETPYAKKQEVIVSTLEKPSTAVNYYSLPASGHRKNSIKGEEPRDKYYYEWSKPLARSSGPLSLPFSVNDSSNRESLPERIEETNTGDPVQDAKKSKRHMLLAMRDIKHAVQLASTSTDDQILSPLTKPPDSSDSEEGSPRDRETHFFRSEAASGRQETVIERRAMSKSSSSEEPTLWLQDKQEDKVETLSQSSTTRSEGELPGSNIPDGESRDGGRRDSFSSDRSRRSGTRADDESKQVLRDAHSPDISFSSGPIEGGKDSGSEADSSHNDISPTHNYTLQSHHEWLKNHLKAATTEKNKLEQVAVELSERAERLEYELADAKEATKSKDEVILLLQSQLTRMESAYTKSLEESLQSRLQLTTHEQEILHLKELCFKYEEEKEKMIEDGEEERVLHLRSRIRALEEEKEKLTRDMLRLEQEKSSLEKRLEEAASSEIIDQCQRWKERFENLEESSKANEEAQAGYLNYLKSVTEEHREREKKLGERNAELEEKLTEAKERNAELEGKLQKVSAEVESEKMRSTLQRELTGSVTEISKKSSEMEAQLRKLEKEMEEKNLSVIKEKEREMQGLIERFATERETLVRGYERRLAEKESRERENSWRKENEKLKQMIQRLEDHLAGLQRDSSREGTEETLAKELSVLKEQCILTSESIGEIQRRGKEEMDTLTKENINLKTEVKELKRKLTDGDREKREISSDRAGRREVIELRNKVQGLEETLTSERKILREYEEKNAGLEEQILKITADSKQNSKAEGGPGVKQNKRRGVGKEDELAWSSLYGIKRADKGRDPGTGDTRDLLPDLEGELEKAKEEVRQRLDSNLAASQEKGARNLEQRSQLHELQRQILSLQSRMTEEKATRSALEGKLAEMEMELRDKQRLEQEIYSLRRRIERDFVPRSEIEVLKLEKELARRRDGDVAGESPSASGAVDYKTKCERLAREMEKSKEIRRKMEGSSEDLGALPRKMPSQESTGQACQGARQTSLGISLPQVDLEPEIKTKLNRELDKSIKKHLTDIRTEIELFNNNNNNNKNNNSNNSNSNKLLQ